MKQYRYWQHDCCPRCGDKETPDHILRCNTTEVQELWSSALLELRQWLEDRHTNPAITESIITLLSSWVTTEPAADLPGNPSDVHAVYTVQAALGLGTTMSGFLINGWAEIQHRHYRWLHRQNSGLQWLPQLIQKLWDVAWDLWMHRNEALHRSTGASDRDLDQAIHQQYELGWLQLPVSDRRWFEVPIDILLKRPRRSRRAWLRQAELIRLRSEQTVNEALRKSRQLMHAWLQTA